MIEISKLTVRYRRGGKPIIKNLSIKFDDKYLILGPNGSGKTTLFRAIAGLTPIESGEILIDGVSISNIYGRPGLLSVNLNEVYRLLHLSAYDHLKIYIDLACGDLDLALEILSELGLDVNILKRRKPWELSAGQHKAFSTAIALASKAKHILLDEPFEQLDPARKSRLIEYLRKLESIILLNTHETWLLPILKDWNTVFMFEGRVYGPIKAGDLLDSTLVVGEADNAILRFEASSRRYSIVKGGVGEPITKLTTLDKVYELAIR